jgi:hypothetical protein
MMYLPDEIINHIINLSDPNDIFIISLVCKRFSNIIQKNNNKSLNNSYFISQNYNIILTNHNNKITSPNCLNIIAYHIVSNNIYTLNKISFHYIKMSLIKQFCITNNKTINKYSKLIFMTDLNPKIVINKMLKWALLNDSYDVVDFILGFGPKINRWAMFIIKHYPIINDNIKRSLTYLIKNCAINLSEFYREMLLLKDRSELCHEMGEYIKYHLSDDIRYYIKQNLHNYSSFIIYYVY